MWPALKSKTSKTKLGLFSSVTATIIALGVGNIARADCDADILAALRTRTGIVQNQSVSDTLHQAMCSQNSTATDQNFAGHYDVYALDASSQSKSLAESCLANDRSYFESNALQLAMSYIPESAIKACFNSGLALSAMQSADGENIRVTAHYVAHGDESPGVDTFAWTPLNAMTCQPTINTGDPVYAGGKTALCTRLRNVDISLALTMKGGFGTKSLTLPHSPDIGKIPIQWHYIVNIEHDSLTKCVDQFGEPVATWKDCHANGTCFSGDKIIAQCNYDEGSCYWTIDRRLIHTSTPCK